MYFIYKYLIFFQCYCVPTGCMQCPFVPCTVCWSGIGSATLPYDPVCPPIGWLVGRSVLIAKKIVGQVTLPCSLIIVRTLIFACNSKIKSIILSKIKTAFLVMPLVTNSKEIRVSFFFHNVSRQLCRRPWRHNSHNAKLQRRPWRHNSHNAKLQLKNSNYRRRSGHEMEKFLLHS